MTLLNSPMLPNILYLLFVLGLWTLALAIVSPGTGVLEVVAVFGLGAAAVGTAVVPMNAWALIPIVLGVGSFWAALVRPLGVVLGAGGLWEGREEAPIAVGAGVRVVERDVLVLTVETDSAS